ncbi:MAG: alpha/beta fold hydrolase, partial [Burkholderiales bacterium]
MPTVVAHDGVKLHYEEAGSGTPVVFVHEFAGDWRSWEPQMRYFSRNYRCITYSARGYLPSDVPKSPDRYSQDDWREDVHAVIDGLKL